MSASVQLPVPSTPATGNEAEDGQVHRYIAASVPRYIRLSRLPYLSTSAVIGSWRARQGDDESLIYDVIMLRPVEFNRARINLGLQNPGSPSLDMSKLTPAYIPMDVREVLIPKDDPAPHAYARRTFWGKDWLAEVSNQ